jgi:vitamin K-dependent gamma-carboxylase
MKRSKERAPARDSAPAPEAAADGKEWLLAELARPVDGASAAFWRIGFGLVMAADLLFYLFDGRLERIYLEPVVHFKYPFFAWVEVASAGVMRAIVWLGLLAALALAAGFFYRVASVLVFVVLVYLYLLEVTAYNNHNYLFCLFAFLCIFLPLNRVAAVDARRSGGGKIRMWVVWLLRFQVGIPYFFGGIAKLNYDWLARAQPMMQWLRTDNLGGTLKLGFFQDTWFAYAISWSGLLFDLLIVPALVWRKSRPWAFVLLLVFNVANSQLFYIGMFPWAMILLSTIFFEPAWPRRLGIIPAGPPPGHAGNKPKPAATSEPRPPTNLAKWALGAWVAWQMLMPLRHFLYPGNVDWTEEGHRYSWRMKIRDKQGEVRFMLMQMQTQQAVALKDAEALLTERQLRYMVQDPELIRQFAHFLAGGLYGKGYKDFEIRAFTNFSLNERPSQPLIDPETDLASQPATVLPKSWIVPLKPLLP